MKTQKCCAHCPGKQVLRTMNESHDCCLPKYVSGNLRVSSLKKHDPSCLGDRKRVERKSVGTSPEKHAPCYDKFAMAKRLHAENLEHQPLPDKVDDSVFKNVKPRKFCHRIFPGKCDCSGDCQEEEHEHERPSRRYGPVLGCKKPETRMDLAICWETPVNPIYEPARPTHIDGSEGGLAPAIFTLVQHTPNSTRAFLHSGMADSRDYQSKNCPCKSAKNSKHSKCEDSFSEKQQDEDKRREGCRSCCNCLCNDLNQIDISNKECNKKYSKPRHYFRKCEACKEKNIKRDDPRLIKSAVGVTLGIQKDGNNSRRNGLPGKKTVPRPRTPFARRSFCIDTLAPPFSIVNGCRDADYPEHWRLMSVYQQSYKNPQKHRTTYHC